MVKTTKGTRYYNLWRNKKEEDAIVHLWYADTKLKFIVSLVGKEGDVSIRISTPKGSKEYLLPFAKPYSYKYPSDDFGTRNEFRIRVAGMIKRDFGYDVLLREQ